MKKITVLLALAFLIISACVIYLVRSGVSLRAAPIIRPSIVTSGDHNIPPSLAIRLSPDFQSAHYVLWGALPDGRTEKLMNETKNEYEKLSHRGVTLLQDPLNASPEDFKKCPAPCWMLVPNDQVNEMLENEFLDQKIRPLQSSHISITMVPFKRDVEIPEVCLDQKRLTPDCLKPLSIHAAHRKMKEKGQRYFFMNKYQDRDFFLFIEENH